MIQLQPYEIAGVGRWTNNVFIKEGNGLPLTFRSVDATILYNSQGYTEVDITPDAFNTYKFVMEATPPTDMSVTKAALVYYKLGDDWILADGASRMMLLPQTKEIDWRLLSRGFDAMPSTLQQADKTKPLIIGGGVPAVSDSAFNAAQSISLDQIPSTIFDYTKPVLLVHDKLNKVLYWLNSVDNFADLRKYGQLSGEWADVVSYYGRQSHRRQVTAFLPSGIVEQFNVRMIKTGQVDLGYRVVRAVYRFSRDADTMALIGSFAVIDDQGHVHILDNNLVELRTLTDAVYVDAHTSLDAYITKDGALVGNAVTSVPPAGYFFYSFTPDNVNVYGIQWPILSTSKFIKYNFVDNISTGPYGSSPSDLLMYNTTAGWTTKGGVLTSGQETNGRRTITDPAGVVVPSDSLDYWSYASITARPVDGDRNYFYLSRPTATLTHVAVRDYDSTLPEFNQELGPTVIATFDVAIDDPNISLPIELPTGIVWTATVNGFVNKPVTRVQNGDRVTITASHEYLTSTPFPISIGRSTSVMQILPDSMPDAFQFENAFDLPENEPYTTETVAISGINVIVPVSVLMDGQPAEDKITIIINGVDTPMPVYVKNGDTLALRIEHGTTAEQMSVTVGDYTTEFGLYTITEHQFEPLRNWCYMPIGAELVSDVMTNTGSVDLQLEIVSGEAEWEQGGQKLVLPIGASTRLKYTVTEHKQNTVRFKSVLFNYTWDVWSDDHWLGTEPQTARAERYVFGETPDITFENIPPNFYTNLHIPAGVVVELNGEPVNLPLDSRGVYSTSTDILGIKCEDTTLVIGAFPAAWPHYLTLGDAHLNWLYTTTQDVVLQANFKEYVEQPQYDAQYQFLTVAEFSSMAVQTQAKNYVEQSTMAFEPQIGATTASDFGQTVVVGQKHVQQTTPMAFQQLAKEIALLTDQGYVTDIHVVEQQFGSSYLTDLSAIHVEYAQAFIVEQKDLVQTTGQEYDQGQHNVFDPVLIDAPGIRNVQWIKPESGVDAAVPEFAKAPDVMHYDNSRVKYANPVPTYGFDNTTRVRHALGEPVHPIDNTTRANNVKWDFNQHDALVPDWTTFLLHQKDASVPRVLQFHNNYQMQIVGHVTHGAYQYHHDMTPSPIAAPYVYKIGTAWQLVRRILPQTDIVPAVPRQYEYYTWYNLGTQHQDMPQPMTYKHDAFVPDRSQDGSPYKHLTDHQIKLDHAWPMVDTAVPNVLEKIVHAMDASVPKETRPSVAAVSASRPMQTRGVTISVAPPVLVWDDVTVDQGEQDPLKNGYFATELAALQNATQVWNMAPELVYGIQQPDGTWTWAQVVVCEETCGTLGCNVRGYLNGG